MKQITEILQGYVELEDVSIDSFIETLQEIKSKAPEGVTPMIALEVEKSYGYHYIEQLYYYKRDQTPEEIVIEERKKQEAQELADHRERVLFEELQAKFGDKS